MINYDSLSVHELILAVLALQEPVDKDVPDKGISLGTFESILRRAVIREAQKGEVLFTVDEHGTPIAVGATEIKAGEFYLVPKEEK